MSRFAELAVGKKWKLLSSELFSVNEASTELLSHTGNKALWASMMPALQACLLGGKFWIFLPGLQSLQYLTAR